MIHTINRLFRRSWFPLSLQVITLGVFALLVAGGLSANTRDMAYAKVLRNTNLANLIVWSYWWPLIILSAIFLGRVWCTLCPMELVTSLAARVGIKKRPPAFIRSGWAMTGFYLVVLVVGIHTLAIHRVPLRMGIYLLALLTAATLSGLVFSRNTFCAHICPVGHLLGLYSRLAPFGWGVKRQDVCTHCKDKSCIANENAYVFQGRSCEVGLYPARIDVNDTCILCGQCLKACDQHNPGVDGRPSPGWQRRPWFHDILMIKPLAPAQVGFLIVVSGFVIYELFTEWDVTGDWLLWIPTHLEHLVGASGPWGHGLVKSVVLFLFLPALVWLLPYGLFRATGGRLSLRAYFLRFGVAFVPIMAAAHATKALLKTTSRIPYWSHAVADPNGLSTATSIVQGRLTLPSLPVWRGPLVTVFALGAMTIAIVLSGTVIRKLGSELTPEDGWRRGAFYLIPILFGGAFLSMFVAWRIL